MTDEDAKYYQEHKDDAQEWGEPVRAPKRSERRRLASIVSIRFSPDEEARLRQEAERRGMSLSRLVREAVLREVEPVQGVTREFPGDYWTRTTSLRTTPQVKIHKVGVVTGGSEQANFEVSSRPTDP